MRCEDFRTAYRIKSETRLVSALVRGPLNDVPLQDGLPRQNPGEAEPAQVQGFKLSVQHKLRHGATHRRRVLQAMAAEAGGEVHVVDQRMHADDAVLVECVVVVETGPGAGHLTG